MSYVLAAAACLGVPSSETGSQNDPSAPGSSDVEESGTFRVAVFNIEELSTEKITQTNDAGVGINPQARAAARIIQRVRPDILVLNEIDHDYSSLDQGLDLNARRFATAYLATGEDPIEYPYTFAAPNNTGILSGVDLDNSGIAVDKSELGDRAYGDDSFGFGLYPGQYSMAVLSRFPIAADEARTFQMFLWKDLPGNHIPSSYFSPEALAVFRLSSKSHWDVPIRVGDRTLHLLVSHPTPPVFDGAEDKNGRRNFDEIKFWVEYLDESSGGEALYDDEGKRGGFGSDVPFVILGDLNAYPGSSEGVYDGMPAISQLLDHPRIRDTGPLTSSRGALEARGEYRGGEPGPPRHLERATASWAGGVRVDYVLPSTDLSVAGGGVFWPAEAEDPLGAESAEAASDHHLVWLDVAFVTG
jgi:endonuclease/exonuclease/phosphatase family metal-dependent hydrolase